MGKRLDDENVKKYQKSVPFNILSGESENPIFELTHNNEKILKSAEDMSALVLSQLKSIAEKALNCRASTTPLSITSAVITVPAYFGQSEKTATIRSATNAGFKECQLITEPAAAACAYGYELRRRDGYNIFLDGYNILVFDFGGGTFDVAILKVKNGAFVQIGIDGDNNLGGRDLDLILRDYCANEIKENWGRDCFVLKQTAQQLLYECEDIKEHLSRSEEESLSVNRIFGTYDENMDLLISRETLENLIRVPLEKSINKVNELLRDCNYTARQIDKVLLVGGTSQIPLITELLVYEVGFAREKISHGGLNPDEAVAKGAAFFAEQKNKDSKFQLPMKLVEATRLSLGVKSNSDTFEVMIPRNSPIPSEKPAKSVFATSINNQTSIRFEGERLIASKNNFLGSLVFDGLKKGRAGDVSVSLTLEIDRNGILRASAQHEGVETVMDMEYEPNNPNRNFDAEIQDARKHLRQDTVEKERLVAMNCLKLAIARKKYKCSDPIRQICDKFEQCLEANKKAAIQFFKTKLDEFEQEIAEVSSR